MRTRYGRGSLCDVANQPNDPASSRGTPAGQSPFKIGPQNRKIPCPAVFDVRSPRAVLRRSVRRHAPLRNLSELHQVGARGRTKIGMADLANNLRHPARLRNWVIG